MKIRTIIPAVVAIILTSGCGELPVAPDTTPPSLQQQSLDEPAAASNFVLHNNGEVAGELFVSNDNETFFFELSLDDADDTIQKVYVHIAPTPEELPRNQADNPVVGQFDHKFYEEDSDVYSFTIARDQDFEKNGAVVIAVYAATTLGGDDEAVWAGDDRFRGEQKGGNWATYFSYTLHEDLECSIEEAWKFINGIEATRPGPGGTGHYYIEGEESGDSYSFPGTYQFASYGTLEIDGSTLTVTANPGYQLKQVRYLNTEDDEINNYGRYLRSGPYHDGRTKIEIEALAFDKPLLYIEGQFTWEACQ